MTVEDIGYKLKEILGDGISDYRVAKDTGLSYTLINTIRRGVRTNITLKTHDVLVKYFEALDAERDIV